jgi:hypothetical protein
MKTTVLKCKVYKNVMCWLMNDNTWTIEGIGENYLSFDACKHEINKK